MPGHEWVRDCVPTFLVRIIACLFVPITLPAPNSLVIGVVTGWRRTLLAHLELLLGGMMQILLGAARTVCTSPVQATAIATH